MYGSWTENVVLWRNFLGIILDQWDVFMVYICSARAQIQSFKILMFILRDDFENRFLKNNLITTTKNVVNSTLN